MATIEGNDQDNKLQAPDWSVVNMFGYGGNDSLVGSFGGDSYIWGGAGNDTVSGGTNLNRLYGDDGNDYVYVFWSSSENQLYGGSGNDTLAGGAGYNGTGSYLDGGTGADLMYGGESGDTFIVDDANDYVVDSWVPEFDNEANPADTLITSVSFTLAEGAMIESFEAKDYATSTKAINLSGNSASQTIKGNAGVNALSGNGGNDVLIGGLGADALNGGSGTDTASYAQATAGVTVNLAKPASNKGEAAGDTFVAVENITASKFKDFIYGNSLANKLTGGLGDDFIAGDAGKDAIKGESGVDKITGGLDNDTLTGGSGADIFVFKSTLGLTNIDQITDFAEEDIIHLDDAIFTNLVGNGVLSLDQFVASNSGKAADSLDRIIYESDTGKLFYDADGSGSGKSIQFATLGIGLSVSADDFFVI